MTASETAISTAMDKLEVESNLSTPESHSPVPKNTISEDTVSILEEASAKLKKSRKVGTRRERDNSPDGRKGTKRMRVSSPDNPKERFPEAAKPLYLKAKNLYIRKLHLATSVHIIKNNLEEGKFPAQIGFKCAPPSSDNTQFSLDWTKTVNQHKRQLTNMWIDELSRKYTVCKSDIRKVLENLKVVLSSEQFSEMKGLLDERYKEAASKKLSKKTEAPTQARPKKRQAPRKGNRAPKKSQVNNQQMQKILKGLSKLLK